MEKKALGPHHLFSKVWDFFRHSYCDLTPTTCRAHAQCCLYHLFLSPLTSTAPLGGLFDYCPALTAEEGHVTCTRSHNDRTGSQMPEPLILIYCTLCQPLIDRVWP